MSGADPPPPRVAIVLVNHNGLDDTLKCLDSISRITYPAFETIVVDNGSADDPGPAITAQFPACHLLRLPDNRGYAGGNNAGIAHALARGADYVLLINNDTVVSERILTRLVDVARRNPSFGVIGPVINWMDEPDEVMIVGYRFDPTGRNIFPRAGVEVDGSDRVTTVDLVNGCCMLVARRVYETIGLIDDRFFLAHEESDFCLRAKRGGFACGIVPETLIWHKGHAWFERHGFHVRSYYNARNLWLLLLKHRGSRPAAAIAWAYFTRIRHLYDTAAAKGSAAEVEAVVAGFRDALLRTYGKRIERRGWSFHLAAGLLESARRANRLRRSALGLAPRP